MNKAIAILGSRRSRPPLQTLPTSLPAELSYGSPTQATAVCFIYNSGSSAVTLTGPTIYNPDGFSVTSPSILATSHPSWARGEFARSPSTPSISLTLVAPWSRHRKDAVRGMLEVRDANGTPLQNVQLKIVTGVLRSGSPC